MAPGFTSRRCHSYQSACALPALRATKQRPGYDCAHSSSGRIGPFLLCAYRHMVTMETEDESLTRPFVDDLPGYWSIRGLINCLHYRAGPDEAHRGNT